MARMLKNARGYLEDHAHEEDAVTRAYFDGYMAAVTDFAVWRDGTQFVGCGVYTLQQIEQQTEADFLAELQRLKR
jgi:hypothetical protein